ncbi:MAG: hypothetical protein DRH11_17390 [Deltaproteobacteria bacterium]|nr:MAG: hypothetical protein DRH11_17390 [Deltaproteobacteria bacterium]
MKKLALLGVIAILFLGCATAPKVNKIQLGMSRAEVIAILGDPISITATQEAEYLNYRLSETRTNAMMGLSTPYYVKIVGGKVEAYGRSEDID